MTEFLRFAILGLGAGAVYGLAALGIVLTYRGSGVVNFAQGAVGMVCAFVFYNARDSGTATWIAWAEALALGALIGALTHVLIMRPLRRAPALSRLIATLGLLTVLFGFGQSRWGDLPKIVTKLVPADGVTLWSDVSIGRDRLIILGIGVALTIVLTAVYRWTTFGLATQAVAENRRATSAQGISPDVVATANWALGGVLAALAAILIVNLSGLDVASLTLLVVPALAAALVGSFRSFGLTLAGGLLIGILESEVAYTQIRFDVTLDGWSRSIPFLVIVIVLVVRGRALPLRGEGVEKPPEIGTGRIRPEILLPVVAVAAAIIAFFLSTTLVEAVTTTLALGIIILSLVVVTGYTGQLSLAQFALAGMGAWMGARAIANWDVPFELAILIGVLGAVPIGILVGLPALRTRGVNLAVATLGLALVIESLVFRNLDRTGGVTGTTIGSVRLFGVDFNTFDHPERYALLTLAFFVGCALLVANLRRGRAGRRLVAVRSNERAATALGISVFRAKLYAFGLSAALAAVGGVLIGFRRPNVTFFPTFSVFQSIFVVIYAVIGGIGFIIGAVIGAAVAPGNFVVKFLGGSFDNERTVQIVLGVALIVVLVLIPNGIASIRLSKLPIARVRLWAVRRRRSRPVETLPDVERPRIPAAALRAEGVTVRFGGVVALDDVSLEVRPGEIHGLIGPNGAGKTTLIDAMTGFVACSNGRILLDDTYVDRWSARRRAAGGIGRSFQNLELFESMTVRENLRTASDARDFRAYLTDLVAPGHEPLGAGAVAAVREFGLEAVLEENPDELPFGVRRQVAIARTVATMPSVLLLDEPAAGLDEHESAELGRLVRRLADDWGMAVLLIEHDVSLVMDICDRVSVLDFGRKIAEGTPAEVLDEDAVIAAYLGVDDEHRAVGGAGVRVEPAVPRSVVGEPLVRATALSAGYDDLAAVRDLDLEVRPGEVVALLGPNGAGKSTTMLTLAGELAPLSGEVTWRGEATNAPLHRRVRQGLGFVPEDRSVFMSLSVGANLRLGRGDRQTALEMFPELEPLLRRRAGLCSGGEQQILTLARALAAEPRLLLADELSLGLAPKVVRRLLRAVREAADRGIGVLLVEQHAREALEFADRAYVLHHGRLAVGGEAADLVKDFDAIERAYLSGIPADHGQDSTG
ncbi:MAG: ATP-binding cassette domain-containing protein [Acidimicrobiia bacterium]|nr:ATP-binding cassette domain-containing protein [Acidimicrobiia bacterium]